MYGKGTLGIKAVERVKSGRGYDSGAWRPNIDLIGASSR